MSKKPTWGQRTFKWKQGFVLNNPLTLEVSPLLIILRWTVFIISAKVYESMAINQCEWFWVVLLESFIMKSHRSLNNPHIAYGPLLICQMQDSANILGAINLHHKNMVLSQMMILSDTADWSRGQSYRSDGTESNISTWTNVNTGC